MILAAAAILALAFGISWLVTLRGRDYFARIGLVDMPGERKLHFVPTPLGGGAGILAGFLVPIVLGFLFAHLFHDRAGFLPAAVAEHLPGAVSTTPRVLPILMGALLIFGIGLVDDRVGLSPGQKLLGQILVAAGLTVSGIRITLFIDHAAVGALLTIGWAVALMNAFNLLDNANGLSAGVAVVVAGILTVVAIQTDQLFIAALLLTFCGALLGFLLFNFPKASIFMGDAGSLLVGYVMAVCTILFTFYSPNFASTHWPILLPLLVMAVPLFDTGSVIFLRIREGRPIFQGDRRHLSHRLMAMGMSETQAVVTIWLLTFCTGIAATLLYKTNLFGCLVILAQTLAVLGLIVVLEITVGARK